METEHRAKAIGGRLRRVPGPERLQAEGEVGGAEGRSSSSRTRRRWSRR